MRSWYVLMFSMSFCIDVDFVIQNNIICITKKERSILVELVVHSHALKHGISESEIYEAWNNYVAKRNRKCPKEDQIVCIGYSSLRESEIQMIGISKNFGILIFHAMSPA